MGTDDDQHAVLERRRFFIATALAAFGCSGGNDPPQDGPPSAPSAQPPNAGPSDPPAEAPSAVASASSRPAETPPVPWSKLASESPPVSYAKSLPERDRTQLEGVAATFAAQQDKLRALYEKIPTLCDLREPECRAPWAEAAAVLRAVEPVTHPRGRLCGPGEDELNIAMKLADNHVGFLAKLLTAVTAELDRQVATTGIFSEQQWLKLRTIPRDVRAMPCLSCRGPLRSRFHQALPFATDSANATKEADAVKDWVRHIGAAEHLQIRGHADATEKDSKGLSLARANAIKALLLQARFDSSRIIVVAFGADMPVATNNTAEGRAQNRSVWIESVVPGKP